MAIRRHLVIHTGEKPYNCPYCPAKFNQKFNCNKHVRKFHDRFHFEATPRKRDDDYQQKKQATFTFKEKVFSFCVQMYIVVFSHLLQNNEPVKVGPKKYACPICWAIRGSPSEIRRHYLVHTGEKPFACTYCDATFNQRSNCNSHMRKYHGTHNTNL